MYQLRNQVCIFLLVSLPATPCPQMARNPVSITGTVLSEGKNERIEHVAVQLCDAGGNVIRETATSDSGEFYFRSVKRERYILKFHANGFQNAEVHLDLSFTSDKGMTVYMKRIESEAANDAAGPSVSAHELSMPRAARDLVASGRRKLRFDKNAQAAVQDFAKAVASAPGYYEAYYEMGMANLTLGRRDEAIKDFHKAIDSSHDRYGDAEVGLGTLLIEKGDAESGEKSIRRGVELNPNSWMGFYELGKLDLIRNRLDSAKTSAERARVLAPGAPIVHRLLANIHLQQKDYPNLLEDLDTYIRLDPDSAAGVRAREMRHQVEEEIAKLNQEAGKSKPH